MRIDSPSSANHGPFKTSRRITRLWSLTANTTSTCCKAILMTAPIREAIRDLFRLTSLDVADEDRVIHRTQTARVGDPLRIGTPRWIQRALRHHPRIVADNLRLLGCDVKHPDFEVRVGEENFLRVGRPRWCVVASRFRDRDLARWC